MSRVVVSPLLLPPVHGTFSGLLRSVWLSFHLWDLDAPSVALAWQFLFARYLHVEVSWAAKLALALAVWLIYAGDRLLDVRHSNAIQQTARHAFHRRHRRKLGFVFALALISLLSVAGFLRLLVLESGLALAGCVGVYLACVHLFPGRPRRWFPKELIVGILFATGTCLAPWCRLSDASPLFLPALFLAALCCLNCVLIEVWEWRDLGCRQAFHPHPWTLALWRALRPLLAIIAASAAVLLLSGTLAPLFSAILLSALCILLLDYRKQHVSADLRRVLVDAALLTPLLFLIASR